MTNLQDALTDLKNEAIQGRQITNELVAEVAADYSLNPQLVRRKFDESYPHPELLANTAAAADPKAALEREIADARALLDVRFTNLGGGEEMYFGAEPYIVFGYVSNVRRLAIRKSDATVWHVPASRLVRAQVAA